jgi:acetyl esterase/lipase
VKIVEKALLLVVMISAAGVVQAQVPPDIAKQIAAIGRGVCAGETAQVYRPLHAGPPYDSRATITRNVSFGPDPKNVLDVFAPKDGGSHPVLIYVAGGPGNKQLPGPNGAVFYDNIVLWAVKNGMVGVNMQRRPGQAWDDPAKDVARLVEWVHQNIASHGGDPERVFIWSQSAGNVPVSTYIAHQEFHGPQGIGLKGAVLMSAPAFNILPATPPQTAPIPPCGQPNGAAAQPSAAAAPGAAAAAPPAAPAPAGEAQADAATLLKRSNLPGLVNSKVPLLISSAELDPPSIVEFDKTLKDELCKAGHCPTYVVLKSHGHISEVMSVDTADDSVTGPILKWMKSIK